MIFYPAWSIPRLLDLQHYSKFDLTILLLCQRERICIIQAVEEDSNVDMSESSFINVTPANGEIHEVRHRLLVLSFFFEKY